MVMAWAVLSGMHQAKLRLISQGIVGTAKDLG
jgi:hypothetical protein